VACWCGHSSQCFFGKEIVPSLTLRHYSFPQQDYERIVLSVRTSITLLPAIVQDGQDVSGKQTIYYRSVDHGDFPLWSSSYNNGPTCGIRRTVPVFNNCPSVVYTIPQWKVQALVPLPPGKSLHVSRDFQQIFP
jgi:hypothetical protein